MTPDDTRRCAAGSVSTSASKGAAAAAVQCSDGIGCEHTRTHKYTHTASSHANRHKKQNKQAGGDDVAPVVRRGCTLLERRPNGRCQDRNKADCLSLQSTATLKIIQRIAVRLQP